MRNHGRSPHHPSMRYDVMAGDVLRLLDTLCVESAILIGHSMGGKVAMATSVLAKERVAGLCVIDISPVRYSKFDGTDWRSAEKIMGALQSIDLSLCKSKLDADQELAKADVLDPQLRAFALMNVLHDRKTNTLSWRLGLDNLVSQLQVIAGADVAGKSFEPYTGPTLFVKGGASMYMNQRHLRATASLFPNYRLKTIEGAGHWVHVTNPKDLQDSVGTLIKGMDSWRGRGSFAKRFVERIRSRKIK